MTDLPPKMKPGKKAQPNRKPGEPYIRADGQPHQTTGSAAPARRPASKSLLLPTSIIKEADPSQALLAEMGRVGGITFDPNDPNSCLYDTSRKFTKERKYEYLQHVATYGRLTYSAHKVGVTADTVIKHRKKDPVFDDLCKQALNIYQESCVALITQQALMGITEYRWDKEGNVLSVRRTFETRLRELILKRADSSYNETQKQELTVQGGAVLVPTPTADVSNWASVVAQLESGSAPVLDTTGVSSGPIADAPEALGEADEDSLGNVAGPPGASPGAHGDQG